VIEHVEYGRRIICVVRGRSDQVEWVSCHGVPLVWRNNSVCERGAPNGKNSSKFFVKLAVLVAGGGALEYDIYPVVGCNRVDYLDLSHHIPCDGLGNERQICDLKIGPSNRLRFEVCLDGGVVHLDVVDAGILADEVPGGLTETLRLGHYADTSVCLV